MKILNLSIITLLAAMLSGCGFGDTKDEPVTAAPVPVMTPTAALPLATATTTTDATVAPALAEPPENIQTFGPHIDASAFLNALVESGCQIDHAEYKEVKRGGAIKIVCSKTVDPLNVELNDL